MANITKNITITIAEAISSDVIDAYADQFSYEDSSTSESKAQFALRMFTEQAQANMRSTYKSYMTGQGAQTAQTQADVDSLNIIVS